MSVADRLRQQGRAEGIASGIARGQRLILLKLIALRFGTPTEATQHRVLLASDDQVDGWVAGILTAESLDELLGA